MIRLDIKKQHYGINREATKILAISPRKINKSEYLTDEKILSFNQRQITEQAKSVWTAFEFSKLSKKFSLKGSVAS